MSCTTNCVGNVFFAKWGVVQSADVNKILWEVAKARATAGKKLVFVSIAPAEAAAPTAEVRAEFTKALKALNENLCLNVMVIQGDGIKKSLIRTVAAAMILISGEREKSCIVDTVEEALVRAKPHLSDAPAVVLARAREQGFVD